MVLLDNQDCLENLDKKVPDSWDTFKIAAGYMLDTALITLQGMLVPKVRKA